LDRFSKTGFQGFRLARSPSLQCLCKKWTSF